MIDEHLGDLPLAVIARVPDLAEHRVRLLLRTDGLDWDCDCEDAKRAPCMHVAAVAIALRERQSR
jgi:uncharacterized Zn finger protein